LGIVGFAFLTLYHKQIVGALKPAADWGTSYIRVFDFTVLTGCNYS